MDLLRSITPHEVVLDGRSFQVPPASVRTALTLLATAEEAARGDALNRSLFKGATTAWLPLRLSRRLFPDGWWKLVYRTPAPLAVTFVMQILLLGRADAKHLSTPSEEKQAVEIEWPVLLADYCATYGTDPLLTLDTPWHLFMQMLLAADSVHAKGMLRYLTAKGLPYIENKAEREKAIRDLQQRAGMAPPEPTEEDKLARQKANLEMIQRTFFRSH